MFFRTLILLILAVRVNAAQPSPEALLAGEDADVRKHVQDKKWVVKAAQILETIDEKPLTLTVGSDDSPSEDATLGEDDLKVLAKLKTVQCVNLPRIKNADAACRKLAGLPQLVGVSLVQGEVSDESVMELAKLPKLKYLHLNVVCKVSGSCFKAFENSQTLESVIFGFLVPMDAGATKSLGKIAKLNYLHIMDVYRNKTDGKLSTDGIREIIATRSPYIFKFDERLLDDDLLIDLIKKGWAYGPAPAGWKETKPAVPTRVDAFSFYDTKLTDRGFASVLNCTGLWAINFNNTEISDQSLGQMGEFRSLKYLWMGGSKVTGTGLKALEGKNLHGIGLDKCTVAEAGFISMANMQLLNEVQLDQAKYKLEWLGPMLAKTKLKTLKIAGSGLGDADVKMLAACPTLEYLTLNSTKLTDAGFLEVIKLPKLRELWVDNTQVTKETYLKARKDFPKLRLQHWTFDR